MSPFIFNACVLMNNQECKTRTRKKDINHNETSFCPYYFKVNKFSGSWNNIFNLKVFNLMLINNEKRHIEFHKTCKCKYRLHASVCNNKQSWNGKSTCELK